MPLESDNKKKVFVIDDHSLVREWLANLINQQPDLAMCGEAGEQAEALRLMASSQPDVVVVDISLGGGTGIELIKLMKDAAPELAIVVLSMHEESIYGERAVRAGARGYVMKREATKKILPAIRSVLEGKLFISEETARAVVERFRDKRGVVPGPAVNALSDRELQVFQLIGHGYTTREIAAEMKVEMKTIHAFCVRIKKKLGLTNAIQLLQEATRWQGPR